VAAARALEARSAWISVVDPGYAVDLGVYVNIPE